MRIESAELKFTVLIEKNENEGYTVTVPSLPGCVTQGDTWDETIANAKEAIAGHIEALRTLGKQIPIEVPVKVPVEVGATS
jgi:predicted RNase H-like HicB family nuclease